MCYLQGLVIAGKVMNCSKLGNKTFEKDFKGVRARKVLRFSFSIEESGVLGEYVEVAMTRNIQFYVSTTIHHSRSTFRKERTVICICGHQR